MASTEGPDDRGDPGRRRRPDTDYIDQVRRATGVHVTPAHLVGRAAAKVAEALPGLNGRVVFGSFAPSPTIDGFFVVSLRTDQVAGKEAAATDLSGSVIREVDTKLLRVIASELAQRAAMIRDDRDRSSSRPRPWCRTCRR